MINTSVFIFTQVSRTMILKLDRLLKNAHLRRSPHPSPCSKHGAGLLQRTFKYASLLRVSGALHLDQPVKNEFFKTLSNFDANPNPPDGKYTLPGDCSFSNEIAEICQGKERSSFPMRLSPT
jgi:hypothetical protein